MTRKDYVKFAEVIKQAKQRYQLIPQANPVWNFIEVEIADIFAADNPRFDRERFARACEPEEETR